MSERCDPTMHKAFAALVFFDATGVAPESPWWWLCSVCGHHNTGTGYECVKCSGEGSAVAEPREKRSGA